MSPVKNINKAIESIFTVNLGVKASERVLVFTDTIRADEAVGEAERERRVKVLDMAKKAAEAGGAFAKTFYLEFPSTGSHGKEPPSAAWEAAFGPRTVEALKKEAIFDNILFKRASEADLRLAQRIVSGFKGDAVDCVIALSNYSTTHTKFRELLTKSADVRYASMPNFDVEMLKDVMDADWNEVAKRTIAVRDMLKDANRVHINTPVGTDIVFSVIGRPVMADCGVLTEKGSYGNLPAGEAFVSPVEGSANGVLALEWAPMRKLKSLVTLKVKDGRVVQVAGEEEFSQVLGKTLKENPSFANIAEFGIGTNDRATKPDNILESEKILGTIHMALGDNSTFGGIVSVPFHQDFVFFNPTVEIEKDGMRFFLLKHGRLVV